MIEDSSTLTFVDLGLTYLQAKTYIALVKLGQSGADVRKISQTSGTAKQDVYRVLPSLQKLGIVQKIIANPTMYRAIPLETALSMLMQRKAEEYKEIQKKAKLMLETLDVECQRYDEEDASRFVITSERKFLFKKMRENIAEAQVSIDLIFAEERMSKMLFYTIEKFQKAIEKGVKIRALTNRDEGKSLDRNIQALMENSSFKIKFLSGDVPVSLVIFDKREVNIRIGVQIVPILWTNNDYVLKLSQFYFDSMWKGQNFS